MTLPTTTFTLMTQVPPPPMMPPLSTTLDAPAAAVTVPFDAPAPVHVTDSAGVGATTIPAGSGSVNEVIGMVDDALELVSVIASVIGSPTRPGDGVNVLLPVGFDSARMDSVAVAGVVLVTVAAPSVAWKPAVTPPGVKPLAGPFAGIVFGQLPAVVETTSSSM